MAVWKNTDGSLHDDMDGKALSLPAWPQGMTELTPEQAQSLQNPPPTQAQALTMGETAIQAALDAFAGTWGYGNPPGGVGAIAQAITYLNSTNAQWKAEATALNSWRDAVWAWAATQQTAILANPASMPATTAAFVAGMPAAPARPAA